MSKRPAEATAIIQRAEATALVLQAQAKATALIQNAGAPPAASATATSTAMARTAEATRVSTPPSVASQATEVRATPGMTATDNAGLSRVELLRVDFAAEGKYIYVEFRAPPRVARQWRQGNVSVIDEATGTIYNGIPVAPIIGPLIAQPVHEGQIGYVMLTNDGLGIQVRLGRDGSAWRLQAGTCDCQMRRFRASIDPRPIQANHGQKIPVQGG